MVGNGVGFETQRCGLTIRNVDLTSSVPVIILATRNDSTVKADAFYVHSVGTDLVVAGSRVSVDVTNSVFDNVRLAGFISDTAAPGSSLSVAFTTFFLAGTTNFCSGTPSPYFAQKFENTIFSIQGTGDVFSSATACTFVSSLLSRQASPPTGAIVADPKFVDLAARNFHLSGSSPAIDAASSISTDHDIEGTPRPQGAKADLGAYEYRQ